MPLASQCWQPSQQQVPIRQTTNCLLHPKNGGATNNNNNTNGLLHSFYTSHKSTKPLGILVSSWSQMRSTSTKSIIGIDLTSEDTIQKKERKFDEVDDNNNDNNNNNNGDDDEKWKYFGFTKREINNSRFGDIGTNSNGRRRRRRPSAKIVETPSSSSSSFTPTTWKYFRKHQMMMTRNNHGKNNNNNIIMENKEIRVQSVHVAQTIDLVAALSKVFGPKNNNNKTRQ